MHQFCLGSRDRVNEGGGGGSKFLDLQRLASL